MYYSIKSFSFMTYHWRVNVYINDNVMIHEQLQFLPSFSHNISRLQIKYIDYVRKYMLIENKPVCYSPPSA